MSNPIIVGIDELTGYPIFEEEEEAKGQFQKIWRIKGSNYQSNNDSMGKQEMRDIKEIYRDNKQFQEYIKRYMRVCNEDIETVLSKKIIQDIARAYEPQGINYRREN